MPRYSVMAAMLSLTFSWVSFGCAVAASFFLAPNLVRSQGKQALVLFVPLLLAAAPPLFTRTRAAKVITLISALGLTAFWLLGLPSVGWFYFPSAAFMHAAFFRGLAKRRLTPGT